MTACLFLAGIVMPASTRYAALFRVLGGDVSPIAHELVLYRAAPVVPAGYAIAREVESIDRAADDAGLTSFHLYGHSGGGAVAVAYAAARPERLLSLALDEASTDFSEEDLGSAYWRDIRALRDLPQDEQIPAFRVLQVAPHFTPPPLPRTRPSWMETGPARIAAFSDAVVRHRIDAGRLRDLRGPAHYSYGSLTNPRYERIRDRLAGLFADFDSVRYEGRHHLESAHQAEPERVAAALRDLWQKVAARR